MWRDYAAVPARRGRSLAVESAIVRDRDADLWQSSRGRNPELSRSLREEVDHRAGGANADAATGAFRLVGVFRQ